VRNARDLGAYPGRVTEALHSGGGRAGRCHARGAFGDGWRRITYREGWNAARAVGQACWTAVLTPSGLSHSVGQRNRARFVVARMPACRRAVRALSPAYSLASTDFYQAARDFLPW